MGLLCSMQKAMDLQDWTFAAHPKDGGSKKKSYVVCIVGLPQCNYCWVFKPLILIANYFSQQLQHVHENL